MAIEMDIKGLKDLNKNLKRMQGNDAKKSVRNSHNAGASKWVKFVKAKVPAGYNTLQRAITKKSRRPTDPTEFVSYIGYTQGKNARYDAFYGHMVEFGISSHDITPKKTKSGESVGAKALNAGDENFFAKVTVGPVPAKPFLRPTFTQPKVKEVEKSFAVKMFSEIRKRLKL
jgi:HK97 gp10 family phage protein